MSLPWNALAAPPWPPLTVGPRLRGMSLLQKVLTGCPALQIHASRNESRHEPRHLDRRGKRSGPQSLGRRPARGPLDPLLCRWAEGVHAKANLSRSSRSQRSATPAARSPTTRRGAFSHQPPAAIQEPGTPVSRALTAASGTPRALSAPCSRLCSSRLSERRVAEGLGLLGPLAVKCLGASPGAALRLGAAILAGRADLTLTKDIPMAVPSDPPDARL